MEGSASLLTVTSFDPDQSPPSALFMLRVLSENGEIAAVSIDTLIKVVKPHAHKLRLVVLMGCKTEHLAKELRKVGIQYVICWRSKVADSAGPVFGSALAAGLAGAELKRSTIKRAFEDAKMELLLETEPACIAGGPVRRVQKYKLVDPESIYVHQDGVHKGRVAVGDKLIHGKVVQPRGEIAAGIPLFL